MNETGSNPLLPLEWELFIADGEPHVYDGYLYLYGSMDLKNGFLDGQQHWCSTEYHVIRTRDMENWEDMGLSYSLSSIPSDALPETATRLWAPDLCFNPYGRKYYLYSCTNGGGGIFVASSDSPAGPFTDTKRVTIDHRDILPRVIDPGVLLDDDGKAYIVWPGGEDSPWSIGQLDPEDFSNVLGETVTPIENMVYPFEGPSLRKRGDTYYFIYIQNNGPRTEANKQPARMAYMTSKSPLGPYEDRGVIIDTSDYPGTINVHGSIVEWKDQWFVFYHIPVQGMEKTRYACAAPLRFNPDGTIVPAKPTSCGPRAAFHLDEEIPAISAVDFSGGVKEQRCDYNDPLDAYLFFDSVGSFAGFRYVDFEADACSSIIVKVKSETSGVIEIRADEYDGQLLAEIDLEASEEYQRYAVDLRSAISHRHAVYLALKSKDGSGRVRISSFQFQRR